jgi:hypothetical protein
MIYAFVNADKIVVQSITGSLDENQLARFLEDQRALFGADSFVIVGDDRTVWIGGSYDSDSGVFSPPPSTEPEPIVVDAPIALVEEILPE